jgi:hypothetical protein
VHPQGPLRHLLGDPHVVIRDSNAPAAVPDHGRRYRLEGELNGLLGDAQLERLDRRRLLAARHRQRGEAGF